MELNIYILYVYKGYIQRTADKTTDWVGQSEGSAESGG